MYHRILYNHIFFFVLHRAENPAHNALVSITDLGEIYVNGSIDADEPPLYYMVFTVTATDGETEPATDTVYILDNFLVTLIIYNYVNQLV